VIRRAGVTRRVCGQPADLRNHHTFFVKRHRELLLRFLDVDAQTIDVRVCLLLDLK